MGKAKKERTRLRQARRNADPTAAAGSTASSLLPADAADVSSPTQRQQLIETLTTGTPSQKTVACHAIAHLLSQSPSSPSASSSSSSPFLQPLLVSRLLALLFAVDFDTRLSAAVALHAVASLGQRACAALLKQDGLSAVLSLLTNPAVQQLDQDKRDRFLIQVIGILRDLIENVDSVLTELSSSAPHIHALFALLPSSSSSTALQVEAASLLLQATEENEQLVQLINSMPAAVSLLMQLLANSALPMLARLSIAGVVLNLQAPQHLALLSSPPSRTTPSPANSVPSPVKSAVEVVLSVLHAALQVDVAACVLHYVNAVQAERQRMRELLSAMDHREKRSSHADDGKDSAMPDAHAEHMEVEQEEKRPRSADLTQAPQAKDVERQSQRVVDQLTAEWSDQVDAVKLALELLSNLCAEEDDDRDDDVEETDEKEATASSWTAHALVSMDCFSHGARVLTVQLPLEEAETEKGRVTGMIGDEYGADFLSMVSSLRCRAAALLTNLLLCIPVASVASQLPGLLQYAGQRVTQLLLAAASTAAPPDASPTPTTPQQPLSSEALEEMESLTALFIVISKSLPSSPSASLMSPGHSQPILSILSHPLTPLSIQLNLIDLVPLLPRPTPLSSLLSLLTPPLERMDRVLNALMDVYAEDGVGTDELEQWSVLERMEAALKEMDRLMAGKGKLDREERRRYMESMRNVKAFLAYKPNHL